MKNAAVILFLLFSNFSWGQWVTAGDLNSRDVLCLHKTGSDIYAGTQQGVYYSSDMGFNWTDIGPASTLVINSNRIECLTSNNNNIFAGNYQKLYVTTNNGNSWNNISPNFPIYSIAVYNSKLYTGTGYGLYVSTNNGTNWQQLTIHAVSAFIVTDSLICIGSSERGIDISTDNGVTWNFKGMQNNDYISFFVNGNKIIAGSERYVFVSSDHGNTWVKTFDSSFHIYSITKGYNSKLFLCTSSNAFFQSVNDGLTWSVVYEDIPSTSRTILQDSTTFFAGTSTGVYISENGTNWQHRSKGMGSNKILSLNYWYSQYGDEYIDAGTDKGLFHSSYWEKNWYADLGPKIPVTSILYGWDNFVGTPNGVFKLSNWLDVSNGLIPKSVNLLGRYSYFLFMANTNNSGGLFYSTNQGANWERFADQFSSNLNCFSSYGSYFFAGTDNGIYLLQDQMPPNWNPAGLQDYKVKSIDIYNDAWVYYLVAGTNAGVLVSSDHGNNWIQTNNGLTDMNISAVFVNKDLGGCIYVGTTNGSIYFARTIGANWTKISEGFPANQSIKAFARYRLYLFAGTDSAGIWKRPFSEITGITEENGTLLTKFSLSQNYPNPFNPTTNIDYSLKESGVVKITVYDVLGRENAILVNEHKPAGSYSVSFDASNLSSGVYLYKLESGGFSLTKKFILMK